MISDGHFAALAIIPTAIYQSMELEKDLMQFDVVKTRQAVTKNIGG